MAEEDVATQEQEDQQGNAGYIEIKASAKDPNNPEDEEARIEGSFNFPVGADLNEDAEIYGEETVRDLWLRGLTVKAQAAVRRELENGTHPDDLEDILGGGNWRPDATHTTKKDPKASIMSDYKRLSPEERAELLRQLEEQAQ